MGLTIQEIQSIMSRQGTPCSAHAIEDAINHLSGEGVVYTTLDEDHFKTTAD